MLFRLSASAALLAAWLIVSPVLHACPPDEKFVTVTYPVLDLVVTRPDVTFAGGTEGPWTCTRDIHADPANSQKVATGQPTHEDRLIDLIQNTIAPSTWAAKGGDGIIDYFPVAGALIVNHTPKVQQQVADLLAALRKLQDSDVALEVRIVTIADDDFEWAGVDFNQSANDDKVQMTFLKDEEVRHFLEAAGNKQRTSICQSPRLMLANRQIGTVNVCDSQEFVTGMQLMTLPNGKVATCPKVEKVDTGICFTAQPVISEDGRFVRLSLELEKKDIVSVDKHPVVIPVQNEEGSSTVYSQCLQNPNLADSHMHITALVPDGGTVMCGAFKREVEVQTECATPLLGRIPYLNRLFKSIGYGRETQRVLVLVTPRIVKNTEESPAPAATAVGACVGTPVGCAADHPALQGAAVGVPCGACAGGAIGASAGHTECSSPICNGQIAASAGTYTTPLSESMPRQADVLARLLKAYDEACAEGKTAEAKKYAKAALLIDPTCFSKK
jgi:hypothetical protein